MPLEIVRLRKECRRVRSYAVCLVLVRHLHIRFLRLNFLLQQSRPAVPSLVTISTACFCRVPSKGPSRACRQMREFRYSRRRSYGCSWVKEFEVKVVLCAG